MQRILKVQGRLHEVPWHPVTEPPDTLSKSNRCGMRDARASASMELPSQAAIPHTVSRTPVTSVRREQTAANTEKARYSLWLSHWHRFLSEVRGISVYPRSLSNMKHFALQSPWCGVKRRSWTRLCCAGDINPLSHHGVEEGTLDLG